MSIELQNLEKSATDGEKDSNVVVDTTQAVGTYEHLPRLYSTTGRYEDSYIGTNDVYGSVSKGGIYGDHASLNYVFNSTRNINGDKKKNSLARIRYDTKGTILNYTSKVVSMFSLKEKDDMMGESISCILDPDYLKGLPNGGYEKIFGLILESAIPSPVSETFDKNEDGVLVTGVRSTGAMFDMRIKITKVTESDIQIEVRDASEKVESNEEVILRKESNVSSSSFSSYADTFNQSNFNRTNSFNSNTLTSTSNNYQGLVVDMHEMNRDDGNDWVDIGRYTAGIEEVLTGENGETKKAGMSAVSLTISLNASERDDLRRGLEDGVILLDLEAETITEIVNAILDETELKSITTADLRDPILNVFTKTNVSKSPYEQPDSDKEGCKVYVSKLPFVTKPIIALVRLRHAVVLKESPLSIRYFLFVIGGKETAAYVDLHEMGRAFSLMMSQNWFSRAAKKVNTPRLYIKLMDNFLTRCMMLPPPDPLADNPFEVKSNIKTIGGCCVGKQEKETVMVMLPNTTMQRTNHQLRHRQRVLQEHDATLMKTALNQEPTVEEIEKEKTAVYLNKLTTRDKVVGGVTLLLCLFFACVLVFGHFMPYDDGLHTTSMIGFPMDIKGGFKSIVEEYPIDFRIVDTNRGLYEIRTAIQNTSQPFYIRYELIERIPGNETVWMNETLVTQPKKDKEGLFEVDIMDQLKSKDSDIILRVSTNSSMPLGYMLFVDVLKPIGRYRILLGSLILVAAYALLLLEVINRAVVAFIGAFVTLLLVSCVSHAPSLDTVVNWMDSSTLCLLFGMMIMIQMLSTTGLFEYLAVSMLIISKGNILVLNICLCLLTCLCSAFLDNVTTMLLIAPVTIELARMMKINPLPFLLPEVIYSNIGGTATLIGDPPNIIIGNMLKEHIDFMGFIKNTMPCVLICIPCVYVFVYFFYKKDLTKPNFKVDLSLKDKYQIKNKPLLLKCGIILLTVIVMLFLHSFHGIDPAYLAIAGAFACLFLGTNEDLHTTFELLEWETLVFFAGLFIMIEGINELGVIRAIGNWVSELIQKTDPKYQSLLAHMLILWVSGLASSVLDNIAFTATMIPIIQILAQHPDLDFDIYTLAWVLAFGACFGGNGTLVGAGANLVTAGISSSNGYPITFGVFFKFGFISMMITMVVSTIYVWIRYV